MAVFELSKKFQNFLSETSEIFSHYFNTSPENKQFSSLKLMGINQYIISNSIKDILDFKFNFMFRNNSYNFYWSMAISESIKNSYDHGLASEKGLSSEIYLGSKGLGFGIFDGGDFYKQPLIKELVESRKPIPKELFPSIYKNNSSGGRHGMDKIYSHSDFLEIDITKGILFIGFTNERILSKK